MFHHYCIAWALCPISRMPSAFMLSSLFTAAAQPLQTGSGCLLRPALAHANSCRQGLRAR